MEELTVIGAGGDRPLTINDVAKELGVSASTVSRAISGKGRIGAGTRERILAYIAEHDYHPNVIAKSLAKSRTYNIAIIIPEIKELVDMPFFQNCMYGVEEVAQASEYDTLIVTTNGKDTRHLERLIHNNKVDGMILTRTFQNDTFAEFLKSRGIPFVTVGSLDDEDVIQVDNNHREACRELVSILLSRGMDRIALVGGHQEYVVNENRYEGYAEAFHRAGREVQEELLFLDVDNSILSDRAVETLLNKEADCILCQDDSICHWVLNKLKNMGVEVPSQIKVASCFDSRVLANSYIPITTLKFDILELGRTAGRILLDYIDGKPVPRKTLLDYEIVLKESTK